MKLPCWTEQNAAKQLYNLNCLLRNLDRAHSYVEALNLFTRIHRAHDFKPDQYSLSTAISACAHAGDRAFGSQLHAHSIRSGLSSFSHVANTLLSLHAEARDIPSVRRVFSEIQNPDVYSWTTLLSASIKLGQIGYARQMFDQMPQRDVAVWNAMITGCAKNGQEGIAFTMFREMHTAGIHHDKYSFASALSLCCLDKFEFGRQVHSLVVKTGFLSVVSVVNALLTMYFQCEDSVNAYNVFDEAELCNEVTFNVMIDGLVTLNRDDEALVIFKEMQKACFRPTDLTFVPLMSSSSCKKVANQLHAQAIKTGLNGHTSVGNAAISMYSDCGDPSSAYIVFEKMEKKDLVSWNSIVSCFARAGHNDRAISAFQKMCRDGIDPDEYSFGSLLGEPDSCTTVEMIQALVFKNGLISNIELSNALVSAYSKLGQMEQACKVFDNTSAKNLISWNTLMSGFLWNRSPLQGLDNFSKLLTSGFKPDTYSLSIVLTICSSPNVCSLRHGKQIHCYIVRNNFFSEVSLGNALITLYSKCGVLNYSLLVFNNMVERDIVSWNALISAYGQHGKGKEAVNCLQALQSEGLCKPDEATFTAVMSACSHAGLVEDTTQVLESMVNVYGLVPREDHISCLLDLLGRGGYLDEAESMVNNSQSLRRLHSTSLWALFSACAAYGNIRLGKLVAQLIVENEGDGPEVYVLLSKIYADHGQWDEAASVRQLMSRNGVAKQRGCSWVGS